MRVLIAGSGGVGGYFGGRLARAGVDVVFLARGRNLAALRRDGLTIESIDGDVRLPRVAATDTLAGLPPVDVAIVTVKSYDTATTAALIAPVITPRTIVLSLQNGIENEALLASSLGLPPLLGAMTHIGAELVAPAVVRHIAQGTIFFGEMTGHESERTRTLVALFRSASVGYHLSSSMLLMLWDKLSWNASFNAITALTRSTSGEAARHAPTAHLLRETLLEVIGVARAQGILLDPARVDGVIAHAAEHLGALRTSMLQDVERGRRLEYYAINGAVVRTGEAIGVPTPLNRMLVALLAGLENAQAASRNRLSEPGDG